MSILSKHVTKSSPPSSWVGEVVKLYFLERSVAGSPRLSQGCDSLQELAGLSYSCICGCASLRQKDPEQSQRRGEVLGEVWRKPGRNFQDFSPNYTDVPDSPDNRSWRHVPSAFCSTWESRVSTGTSQTGILSLAHTRIPCPQKEGVQC